MHERWFVLRPLCDVAPAPAPGPGPGPGPGIVHPVLGKSVRELLAAVEAEEARVGR